MDRCCHGLVATTCSGCKTKRMPSVYLSAGGDTYHSVVSCPAFHAGRRKAARYGYENREIEQVAVYQASLRDFLPCHGCRGKAAFATRAS